MFCYKLKTETRGQFFLHRDNYSMPLTYTAVILNNFFLIIFVIYTKVVFKHCFKMLAYPSLSRLVLFRALSVKQQNSQFTLSINIYPTEIQETAVDAFTCTALFKI